MKYSLPKDQVRVIGSKEKLVKMLELLEGMKWILRRHVLLWFTTCVGDRLVYEDISDDDMAFCDKDGTPNFE